jgi:hypothetical protein
MNNSLEKNRRIYWSSLCFTMISIITLIISGLMYNQAKFDYDNCVDIKNNFINAECIYPRYKIKINSIAPSIKYSMILFGSYVYDNNTHECLPKNDDICIRNTEIEVLDCYDKKYSNKKITCYVANRNCLMNYPDTSCKSYENSINRNKIIMIISGILTILGCCVGTQKDNNRPTYQI